MIQYIDKDKIDKIIRNLWKEDDVNNSEHRIFYNKALQEVQCEIDNLEVKEMDLEKEIGKYLDANDLEKQREHKPYGQRKECEDCQFNYAGECKGYCALKRNEHKPTEVVASKFHTWVNEDDADTPCVTQALAMKWLREEYDLHIIAYPYNANGKKKWCCQVYKAFNLLGNEKYVNETLDSYEQAVEAALKWCPTELL